MHTRQPEATVRKFAPSELFDGYARMTVAAAYIGEALVYNVLISTEKVRDLLIAANNTEIKIAAKYSGIYYANFNVAKNWTRITNYGLADFSTLV